MGTLSGLTGTASARTRPRTTTTCRARSATPRATPSPTRSTTTLAWRCVLPRSRCAIASALPPRTSTASTSSRSAARYVHNCSVDAPDGLPQMPLALSVYDPERVHAKALSHQASVGVHDETCVAVCSQSVSTYNAYLQLFHF